MFWVIVIGCFVACFNMTHDVIHHHSHNPIIAQYQYEYKVQKQELKEEYEKSQLPKSGYMLREEYEKESKSISNKARIVEPFKYPKQSDWKYIPQATYKLVRYNNPPGSPELCVPRRIDYQRQINSQGIISGDFTKLVYSSVYYYPQERCTACDVFYIPLDIKKNRIERVQTANVVKKIQTPIFSTVKDTSTEGAYRTITPVDFSEDNRYIVAKEKVGYIFDGIWRTDVLVYDFQTGQSKKLTEIREAITNYWHNVSGVDFDDKRWDIYPLGFDKNDNSKILVSGYAYTGGVPSFLGTWSVDINGERCELVDLGGTNHPVSIVGYKLIQDSYIPREQVEWEANRQAKIEKNRGKKAKKAFKQMKKERKHEYKMKLKALKAKYKLRVKEYKKHSKKGVAGAEDNLITPSNITPQNLPKDETKD